jgi:MoxR-like ATPase
VKGPIFCHLLLADELNRTPPKTQAALLQGMQEKAVTTAGQTLPLPRPFQVFATQNPIEQAGTYPLPEAQLDRFMFQVSITYPPIQEELEIIRRTTVVQKNSVTPILSCEELVGIQQILPGVPCADHLVHAAVQLVRLTRPDADAPERIRNHVTFGAGPRAGQMLVMSAKARALLHGRFAVDINDIRAMAFPVLRHRLVLSFEADARGVTPDELIESLLPLIHP